jgi:hypothetical protein
VLRGTSAGGGYDAGIDRGWARNDWAVSPIFSKIARMAEDHGQSEVILLCPRRNVFGNWNDHDAGHLAALGFSEHRVSVNQAANFQSQQIATPAWLFDGQSKMIDV